MANTPFFVKDVSFDDVVAATLTLDGYVFERVLARAGHSTYRVIPQVAPDRAGDALRALEDLGCSWEEGPLGLIAVDVPPDAAIDDVYAALEAGANESLWDFEEGHVGHRTEPPA